MQKTISRWVFGTYQMSNDEKELLAIVKGLLRHPQTSCKRSSDGTFFIVNHEMHYYIKFNHNLLKITNSVMNYVKSLHTDFQELIQAEAKHWIDEEIKQFDTKIFANEMIMLKRVNDTIQSSNDYGIQLIVD